MKLAICMAFGAAGSFLLELFGGWDASLLTLILLMGTDYLSGLILAAVFRKSRKSPSGALESRAGFIGLCKKCMMLFFVLVAARLDLLLGSSYLRSAVILAFCANETLSLIENAGLMGLPIPKVIRKAVDLLLRSDDGSEE